MSKPQVPADQFASSLSTNPSNSASSVDVTCRYPCGRQPTLQLPNIFPNLPVTMKQFCGIAHHCCRASSPSSNRQVCICPVRAAIYIARL